MKLLLHRYIIPLLLLASVKFAAAQVDSSAGYLILNNGATLYGKVEHINVKSVSPQFYKKIRFTSTDNRRRKYKPEDVAGFKIGNTTYEGFWLHQTSRKIQLVNPIYDIDENNGERYFLKVIKKGSLSHYQMEWFEQGESTLWWMDLVKKENDLFLMRATQGLLGLKRKALADYFKDCPDLVKRINEKELNKVSEVIEFYNTTCSDENTL